MRQSKVECLVHKFKLPYIEYTVYKNYIWFLFKAIVIQFLIFFRYSEVISHYNLFSLSCPCHHLYTIGCTIEPPIVWYIQKCIFIWKILFYFSFVVAICSSKMKTRHVMRDRFMEKVLPRWDTFQLARSFHIL